jgi:hypothetical protein
VVSPERKAEVRSSEPESALPSPAAPSQDHRFAEAITQEVVRRAWPRILTLFRKVSPQGAIWLEQAEVVALEGSMVVLAFQESFARDRIQNNEKGKTRFEQTLNQALNTEGYKIRCILRDLASEGGSPVPAGTGPKNRPASGMAASPAPEMGTLLEAPPTSAAAPTRIADFDMPSAAPPTAEYESIGTLESSAPPQTLPASPAAPAPQPPDPSPPENGFLAETLDIFGGEVIRSEPL